MWKHQTALTLAIATILALLIGCTRPLPQMTTPEVYWARKMMWEPEYDLVLAGDSRTNRGVSPAAMTRELPDLRIINFSFQSTAFTQEYLEAIERRLDPDGRRILVLGISPISLTPRNARNNMFLEMHRRHPAEIYQRVNLDSVLRFFSPIEWERSDAPLRTRTGNKVKIYHADGWVSVRDDPPQPTRNIPYYEEFYVDNQVSDEIIDELLSAVRQWTENGISVFAFRPPTTVAMFELEERISGLDENEFAERFRAAGGTWLRFRHGSFLSYDGSHLQDSAARRFSTVMARRIAQHLE